MRLNSVYKRMPSRELARTPDIDEDDISEKLLDPADQDYGNPSWKRSLPHVCVATMSSFLFGYHLGVVNEPLESISMDLGFSGNTLSEGLVVSMCLGGALIGCLFSGWISDGIGRRKAFQLSALPMIIGASLSASATRLAGMLLGRFLVGTGMGLGPPVASLYITEVSPSSVRGTYGSFIQIATCLGLIASLFIGIPVKEYVGWWRVCFGVSIIPAALLALSMQFCAESPHWLYKRGRFGESEAEFERLLGGHNVKSAMEELSRLDRGDEGETVKYSELIYGRHFRVVFIGTMLFALQQLSGINAVFYFSSAVFKSAGVASDIANICVGFANLSGSIVAMLLMDKLGRRVLLLGSFLGMVNQKYTFNSFSCTFRWAYVFHIYLLVQSAAMVLQAVATSFHQEGSWHVYLSVCGMLLFVLAFALGAGPVPGLLLSEIFPSRIRAKAMALCMSVHWVVNFFVGLFFLRLLEQLGAKILYSIFASFCLMAALFVAKNVVETKGKSLQEIEISLLSPV